MKKYYDKVVAKFYKNRPLGIGQLVWLKTERPGNAPVPSLAARYDGPYRIVSVMAPTFGIAPLGAHPSIQKLVHGDKLKPCLFDDSPQYVISSVDSPDPRLNQEEDQSDRPASGPPSRNYHSA